jgi:hypothetical protein
MLVNSIFDVEKSILFFSSSFPSLVLVDILSLTFLFNVWLLKSILKDDFSINL